MIFHLVDQSIMMPVVHTNAVFLVRYFVLRFGTVQVNNLVFGFFRTTFSNSVLASSP